MVRKPVGKRTVKKGFVAVKRLERTNRVRDAIFEEFLKHKNSPSLERVVSSVKATPAEIREAVNFFVSKNIVPKSFSEKLFSSSAKK
jgi:hypothetical protein